MGTNDRSPQKRSTVPGTMMLTLAWQLTTTCALVTGTVLAIGSYGLLATTLVWASCAAMAWMWLFAFSATDHWPVRRVVEVSAFAGIVIAAIAGMSTTMGGWVLLLIALLAATSPLVVTWLADKRQRTARAAPAVSREVVVEAHVTDLRRAPEELDDADLCQAWCDTGAALKQRHSARSTLELVKYRARCLDELGRRNPTASSDWLGDGPPLGVDAKSYLPPGISGRPS